MSPRESGRIGSTSTVMYHSISSRYRSELYGVLRQPVSTFNDSVCLVHSAVLASRPTTSHMALSIKIKQQSPRSSFLPIINNITKILKQTTPMSTSNRQPATQRIGQRPLTQQRAPPTSTQRERLPSYTAPKPDPIVTAAASLNLTRKSTPARKNQRPWTPREWAFVETIPKGIDSEGIKEYMFKFRDKFKWMPSEGQFRSPYWFFGRSKETMRAFLGWFLGYEARRMACKESEGQMVTRLRAGTLRPR